MSEQTARFVDRLRTRLQQTTRRMTWAELAFGSAVAVGAVATVWVLATLLEAGLWLGTTARTAVAAAVATVALGVGAAVLARPLGQLLGLLPGPSEEEVARKVGRHHPDVSDRLVNLLQLAKGKRSHAPAPFVDQAVQQLATELDDVAFDEVEDFGRARRAARLASLPLAAILAFLLLAPSTFLGASQRLLAPTTAFDRPAPFELSVQPGSVQLVRGDSLEITVQATGAAPDAVTLWRRPDADTPPERIALQPDSTGTFRHTVAPVRRSFDYRIATTPVQTDWYRVNVARRPLVRTLEVTVTPPPYTGRSARTLDPNVGDVSALPGATIRVDASLGGPPVETATLHVGDAAAQPLKIQDGTATGAFTLRREGTYHLRLKSTTGIPNRDPIRYQLSLQADAAPSVSFLRPQGPTDLSDDLTQPLRVQLSDDFGFTRAALFYRQSGPAAAPDSSAFSSIRLSLPSPGKTDQELAHEWLLAQESGLDPEPGDVITYYVKAWDNDTVNGPKSGRTATQRLRMPSLSEQYEELDETQTETGRQMEQLQQRADSMSQQFQQLRRELRRTREADWQDQRQLDQLQKKQKSLDQGAKELAEKAQNMIQQMQKNGLSPPEMTKKFQELQRVIKELDSNKLKKALEELQKSMQNNNLRQMQNAMDEAQKNQEDYQEQLDRTLSLFKQLKAQQKLGELSRRAGDLSERQKQLRERTKDRMQEADADSSSSASVENSEAPSEKSDANTSQKNENTASEAASDSTQTSSPSSSSPAQQDKSSPRDASEADSTARSPNSSSSSDNRSSPKSNSNEDLASEQKRAAEQMKKLEEAMKKAQQEMSDVQSAPSKQLQKLNQQLQQRNLPKKMQKNSNQLRQNQLQDAQQGQKQMQQTLQKMQKQLSSMKSKMQSQQRRINLAGLRTALENTLRLSKRQETLRTKVEALSEDGPTIRSYARKQKAISDGFKAVTDSLTAIAKRVPELTQKVKEKSGNALRAMDTAISALDERKAGKATGHQKTSMRHLNELALLLSDLLEQMQNQKGGGGGASMQQMLQKLQQAAGQQQKLNKQIQQHLNKTQGKRLSPDDAKRRKELAKQQRQIKKQLKQMDVGSEAKQKILGDLEKIAEQMEETAQELDQNRRPSRELIKRQQQILTRLLNAQNSLRTQGKENQRKGQSANDVEQNAPGQTPSPEAPDQLRRDLIRALEMGYSSDYESLIKQYFELLRKRNEETP